MKDESTSDNFNGGSPSPHKDLNVESNENYEDGSIKKQQMLKKQSGITLLNMANV